MQVTAILLLTKDNAVWDHWRQIDASKWLPARGTSIDDLTRWQSQGRKLVIMDSGLPGLPEWSDALLSNKMQKMQVVVASTDLNDTEGKEIISAGASGYIHAYSTIPALNTVLDTVHGGGVWMGPTLLARLLRELDQRLPKVVNSWDQNLTAREREVAERAAMGHSNQAIANKLGITERTVRAHLTTIFEKLGVTDRLQLALRVHGINTH